MGTQLLKAGRVSLEKEAVCSRNEGLPPKGQFVNYTNGAQACNAGFLNELHPGDQHVI